jgi:hypothetical protein
MTLTHSLFATVKATKLSYHKIYKGVSTSVLNCVISSPTKSFIAKNSEFSTIVRKLKKQSFCEVDLIEKAKRVLGLVNLIENAAKWHAFLDRYLLAQSIKDSGGGGPRTRSYVVDRGTTDQRFSGEHLYVADSLTAFTDRGQELLDDEAKRKRRGNLAREFVEKYHSWMQVEEALHHIFQRAQYRWLPCVIR